MKKNEEDVAAALNYAETLCALIVGLSNTNERRSSRDHVVAARRTVPIIPWRALVTSQLGDPVPRAVLGLILCDALIAGCDRSQPSSQPSACAHTWGTRLRPSTPMNGDITRAHASDPIGGGTVHIT